MNTLANHETLRQKLVDVLHTDLIREVVVTVAHELNQPLSAVTNYAAALRRTIEQSSDERFKEQLRDMLTHIEDEALRCGDLLRSFYRPTNAPATGHRQADLNPAIADTLNQIDDLVRQHGGQIRIEHSEEHSRVDVTFTLSTAHGSS